jgi:hypothetical protein
MTEQDRLAELKRTVAQHTRHLGSLPVRIGSGSRVPDEDRKVAVDDDDDVPNELIEKLANTDTYNAGDHSLVYGEIVPDPSPDPDLGSNNKLRLFFEKVALGEYVAGCGIDITAGVISFKRTDVIGDGLEAGPGTCNIQAASGVYICELSADMAAASSITAPASQTATVYSTGGASGTTTSLGTRTVYWHGLHGLLYNGRYYCAKTYTHPSDATLDRYTITDASYGGFNANDALRATASGPEWSAFATSGVGVSASGDGTGTCTEEGIDIDIDIDVTLTGTTTFVIPWS